MKTLRSFIFAAAAMFLSFTSSAQNFTHAGTVELGGDVSFSSQSYSNDYSSNSSTLSTFTFNPYIGFMVSNGFELGLMPGITRLSTGGASQTELNLFLALAYNVETKSTVYPYFEFLLGYNSISLNSGYAGDNVSAGGLGLGLDGGMKVNLKGNSLLLFKIQYLNQSFKENTSSYNGPTSSNTSETILNTVSVGMGFRIFMDRPEKKK